MIDVRTGMKCLKLENIENSQNTFYSQNCEDATDNNSKHYYKFEKLDGWTSTKYILLYKTKDNNGRRIKKGEQTITSSYSQLQCEEKYKCTCTIMHYLLNPVCMCVCVCTFISSFPLISLPSIIIITIPILAIIMLVVLLLLLFISIPFSSWYCSPWYSSY